MANRVLLIDDDPAILSSLGEALEDLGVKVQTAADAEAALGLLGTNPPDLVLSDIRMPGMDGLELLELLRTRVPSTDVVLMTAYDDMQTVVRAMREGAFDFLVKPIRLAELEDVLRRAQADRIGRERARRSAQDQARSYQLGELVGQDPAMIEVFKLVGRLASNRVSVLIRGESGTGKELVARGVHYNSPDASEPFVPVNCTSLPETLLESELFGHVKGAFTGAIADRRGRFALAGRGTIFLDEIGDTSHEFQTKLLRVLESGEYYAVGGEEGERTEARVIAATHRDLERGIEAGTFREDLYYRLKVVEVRLPPLRERPGDILPLARHLVRKASERLHREEPILAEDTCDCLMAHTWPGNVRELENCLTRAVALATGGVIHPGHLGITPTTMSPDMFRSMEEVVEEHVGRVLRGVQGNKTRAARILGISKPKLYRLLEKFGIE